MLDLAPAGNATTGPLVDWFRSLPPGNGVRAAVCALIAYVLGCLATGYYLVRIRTGKDIRTIESGNIGARNVGRVLGSSGFFITFLGDLAKGVLSVLLARILSHNDPLATGAAIPAAIAGHLWPAQLGFRGGKGVSTGLGAVLMFDYRLAIPLALAAAVGYALTRMSVPAGMFMFACLPPSSWWFRHDVRVVALLAVACAMIIAAHRSNLVRDVAAMRARRPKAPAGGPPPP
ncbi:MAG TPA: glycerol-3-phosphate acyltransferase [Planctomycetota bacterium]|nr:glycerol-3-phosphate acyltransferase [Planctomycetota bacterium]